jgi:non-specific serine/threonine protein kinase
MGAPATEMRLSMPRRLPGYAAERLRAFGLSRRELAVLELVARGHTNAQAADTLGISPLTVKKHLERMYAATGATNRASLIALLSNGSQPRADERATAKHNLPVALTSFIGREREIEDVAALLVSHRLVTLLGPGGAGKTRLALEVASTVLDRFADGIRLVELADVADERLVLQTIAAVLGVREAARTRIGSVAAELRSKRLLVVLDNCEHLADACAKVVEPLLRACADVRVLATSRERLAIAGERSWLLPPLESSEAVRLFLDRATLRARHFALTPENAPTISHICERLDGLPLAIELAAARLNVLSVDQIATRLDDRFAELRTTSAGTSPRHRTLRGVVDWSYRLLARAEARLFERLSVFSGGCTLDAVQAVCAGAEVEPADVLELVARLVDKSFVIADIHRPEARYRTLETLQRYGRERLEASRGAEAVRARHAAYFSDLAEQAEPKLKEAEQLAWYERLEAEHDNMRAALRWSLSSDPERALRIAGALWRFWDVRMYKEEGRRWLEAALEHEDGITPAVRLKALNGAGNMAQSTGDYVRATRLHERSLALARGLGDLPSVARSLSNLGDQALNLGEHERARALHSDALALFERLDDPWGIAVSEIELGQVAYDLGDLDAAARHYTRGLAMMRTAGDGHRTAHALLHVGKVSRERGDLDAAAAALAAALRTTVEYADAWMTTIGVGQIACLATARGDASEAAVLFGAASAAQRAFGISQAAHWSRDLERWSAAARAALDPAAFETAWSAGEDTSLEDAVARAVAVVGVAGGSVAAN